MHVGDHAQHHVSRVNENLYQVQDILTFFLVLKKIFSQFLGQNVGKYLFFLFGQ